jgi:hypothetical protein
MGVVLFPGRPPHSVCLLPFFIQEIFVLNYHRFGESYDSSILEVVTTTSGNELIFNIGIFAFDNIIYNVL